jgi:hypothetical protein
VIRAQKELAGRHLIDHLLAQSKGWLLAGDIPLQRSQLVVRPRQHLVVEEHHERREKERRAEHGDGEAGDAHAVRLECGHLVFGGEPAERVQRRHEHRHGERHGERERDRESEELADDSPGKPLSDEVSELFGDVVQQQERRERRQGEDEGPSVLSQDVLVDYLHARYLLAMRGLELASDPTVQGEAKPTSCPVGTREI